MGTNRYTKLLFKLEVTEHQNVRNLNIEMEQNFTQYSDSGNPWNVQDKATSALQKAIVLGERTGHFARVC